MAKKQPTKRPAELSKRAQQLVKQFPDSPNRTLARRLQTDLGGAVTLESARSAIRVAAGQKGKSVRNQRVVDKPSRKPGQQLQMPKSQSTEWLPYDLGADYRLGVLSDIHCPYHNEVALGAAVEYLRKRKIDVLLLNGDTLDFYTISRWEQRPSKRNLPNELKQGRQLIAWIRKQFPKQRIVWKDGNHDERWQHWIWSHAPEISEEPEMRLDQWFGFEKLGIEYVTDKRPVMAGELPILHGHELGKSGIANPVNPARGAFLRTHHTILVGHSHQTSNHVDTNMWHDETSVWSTGCLCTLTPEYAVINRWNNGFAEVEVAANRSFRVENLRISKRGTVR